MWSALCFGGVLEGVRDGLDSQTWIMILHAVSTMLTVVSWCENSVPGLDYLIAAHGKVKVYRTRCFWVLQRNSNDCLIVAYIIDLIYRLHWPRSIV